MGRIEIHSLLGGIALGMMLDIAINYTSSANITEARFMDSERVVLQLSRPLGYGTVLYQDTNDKNHYIPKSKGLVSSVELEEGFQNSDKC